MILYKHSQSLGVNPSLSLRINPKKAIIHLALPIRTIINLIKNRNSSRKPTKANK